MPVDTVSDQLKRFIVKTFPLARMLNVATDDPLLESGVIDSLGVLDLVGYIEREFKVEIADDDLLPENFQTIECLTALVRKKLVPAEGASHDGNGASGRS